MMKSAIDLLRSLFSGQGKPAVPSGVPTMPAPFTFAACMPDPYPLYAKARSINPVCLEPTDNSWIVLTYERVLWALKSPELFSNKYSAQFDPFLVGSDGMAHAKARKALTSVIARFQPATIAAFTEKWMDDFFQRIQGRKGFDAVSELSIPLPRDFTAYLLGFTPEEKHRIIATLAPRRTDMNSALQPVREVLLSVMEDIRNRPRDGVCSALIHSTVDEPHSPEEILGTARHLWFEGTVTLSGLLPAAIRALCESPELRGRLAREPERMPRFVSEMLRLEAPAQFVPRMALDEITVDGVTIPPRAMVCLSLASANRDPAAFPNPDVLDLERPPHRHLSFGLGEHFCIGATIAKTIAATALQRLVSEFPDLRGEDSQTALVFEQSPIFRALVSLPVLCERVR